LILDKRILNPISRKIDHHASLLREKIIMKYNDRNIIARPKNKRTLVAFLYIKIEINTNPRKVINIGQ